MELSVLQMVQVCTAALVVLLVGTGADEHACVVARPAAERRRDRLPLLDHLLHDVDAARRDHVGVLVEGLREDLVGGCLGGGRLLVLLGDTGVRGRSLVLADLVLGRPVVVHDGDLHRLDGDQVAEGLLETLGHGRGDAVGLVRGGQVDGLAAASTGLVGQVGERVVRGERRVQLHRQVVADEAVADVVRVTVVLVELGGCGAVDLPDDLVVDAGRGGVAEPHGGAGAVLALAGVLVRLDGSVEFGYPVEGVDEVEAGAELAHGLAEVRLDGDRLGRDRSPRRSDHQTETGRRQQHECREGDPGDVPSVGVIRALGGTSGQQPDRQRDERHDGQADEPLHFTRHSFASPLTYKRAAVLGKHTKLGDSSSACNVHSQTLQALLGISLFVKKQPRHVSPGDFNIIQLIYYKSIIAFDFGLLMETHQQKLRKFR